MWNRRIQAKTMRVEAAEAEYGRVVPQHVSNGEEVDYPYLANFSKGLPHDENGEVDPAAYRALLRAVSTGEEADFRQIPLGTAGGRPLVNPQAGRSFDLEGPDPQAMTMPPAPRMDGAEHTAEAAELYWMALCRDVPFAEFGTHELTAAAAEELDALPGYRGPRVDGRVTPAALFRGNTPDDLVGPYVSQFLLHDIPNGALNIPQRQDLAEPGVDYLTDPDEWAAVQNGYLPPPAPRDQSNRGYPRTPRDMAHYVLLDYLFQAYLGAGLILLGRGAPLNPGNPYHYSPNQTGFVTHGPAHLLPLVAEVSTRAAKAVWHQKWNVHRRMRPEEFGGLVHRHLTGSRSYDMIEPGILASRAVAETHERFGSYLLPQAAPEGCPLHPAYGGGHATTAAACVTVLKAWFDCSAPFEGPVEPSADGQVLVPYTGEDADRMTIGGELNKLAANIPNARNMAGVHWRTDYSASARLGEDIAIALLRETLAMTAERGSLLLRRFDGTLVRI
ncbi:vanadium-dependent haloperoxidase [Allostreptomyces psammosilenae]|nr:vanadium-dependent haloperoxidase [Allostreptomyces psammosilenae]